jgi:hypothetical protein
MSVIFLIRHAEKPDAFNLGVGPTGDNDDESLSVRGWQRAGALLGRFGSTALPRPDRLYAAAPMKLRKLDGRVVSRSKRPLQTMSVVAAKWGLEVDVAFTKGHEAALAAEIAQLEGATLVCWPREGLPLIAASVLNKPASFPVIWPSERFDVVWRLVREKPGAPWSFDQVCQCLMPGDATQPIS